MSLGGAGRVLLVIAACVLCWSAVASAQLERESGGPSAGTTAAYNPVIENLRRNVPDNPVVSTDEGPVVTDAMTREEFLEAIEPVATFDWSQVEWEPGPATRVGSAAAMAVAPDSVADDLEKVAADITDGEVALNAAFPGPGTSVLGVPHAQTLVYGETTAQKFVANGDLQIGTCYFDMYTKTPNATRYIKYGIAWSCNVPWINGYIASGVGEPIYYPEQSVRNLGEFSGNKDIKTDPTWSSNALYTAEGDYLREREDQQVIQYGYVVLAVDGRQGVDGFLTQPGGPGYVAAADCAGGTFQLTVACQFITGPYTWVPTDDTQCGTGACETVLDAYALAVNTVFGAVDTATRTVSEEAFGSGAPRNQAPPQIFGAPNQGAVQRSHEGRWVGGTAITYARQWQRCGAGGGNCQPIPGAQGDSYTPQSDDVGSTLRISVTASNLGGQATAVSGPTAVIQSVARQVPGNWQRGANALAWNPGDFTDRDRRPEARRAITALRRAGANVLVLPIWYFDGELANKRGNVNEWGTLSQQDVLNAACDATDRGFGKSIVLKLQLDGGVSDATPTFQERYLIALKRVARWAIAIGADALDISNELTNATNDPGDDIFWNQALNAIQRERNGYLVCKAGGTGKIVGRNFQTLRSRGVAITASANWDANPSVFDLSFWKRLNYVGVSAYYELTPGQQDPDFDAIYRGWGELVSGPTAEQPARATKVYAKLQDIFLRTNRPIVLTELGYPAYDGATSAPWNEFPSGTQNRALQNRAFDAAFRSLTDKNPPWLLGTWLWNWGLIAEESLGKEYGYPLRGTRASRTICQWYRADDNCPAGFDTAAMADPCDTLAAAADPDQSLDAAAGCELVQSGDPTMPYPDPYGATGFVPDPADPLGGIDPDREWIRDPGPDDVISDPDPDG